MTNIYILYARPSEISSYNACMSDEAFRDEFFDKVISVLSRVHPRQAGMRKDIWRSGVQQRDVYLQLSEVHKEMIENMPTDMAQCWLNGVYGREWDHSFM